MGYKADMSGAEAKIGRICTNRQFGQFLASTAERGMNPYVPWRSGFLAGSAVVSPFKVTYTAPYATYPYHGRHMTISKNHHDKAEPFWDRAYAIAKGQELGDAGTAYLRSLA